MRNIAVLKYTNRSLVRLALERSCKVNEVEKKKADAKVDDELSEMMKHVCSSSDAD